MSGPATATDIIMAMSVDQSDPGSPTRSEFASAAGDRVAALAREAYAAAAVQRIAALPADQLKRLADARAHVAAETVRYFSYTGITC